LLLNSHFTNNPVAVFVWVGRVLFSITKKIQKRLLNMNGPDGLTNRSAHFGPAWPSFQVKTKRLQVALSSPEAKKVNQSPRKSKTIGSGAM